MAMAMFALVLCSLTVSTVLLAGAHHAYGRPDAEDGGYDLRVQGADEASAVDLRAALSDAPAARPDDFPAIGGVRSQGGELIHLGSPLANWHAATLGVVDDEFLQTTSARLAARAAGYADEAQVWRTLGERPGTAIVSTSLAAALGLTPNERDGTPVWLRARAGGSAIRLEVIGVLAARSPLGDGVFVAERSLAQATLPAPTQVTYYVRARDGLTPERAASALNLSLADRGLRASLVDPELRLSRAVQTPLSFLLQGFMGLGLVSGVLAVGLLSARAVLERRSQIGMLRAVGMRAGAVQFSLLVEASVVGLAGVAIGLGVGVVLAGQIVRYLQRTQPEFPLLIPMDQLIAIAVLTWGGAVLAAAVPAWRGGRIAPVEALRCD
jgi:putative ABC transport system permease protein